MAFDIEMIKKVYGTMAERVDKARELVGRPLTLSEKILYSHLWEGTPSQAFSRGKEYRNDNFILLILGFQKGLG